MSIRDFTYDYLKKRRESLQGKDVEALRQKLYQIKKGAVGRLDSLKKETIENLKVNGFFVHEAKDDKEAQEILKRLIGTGKRMVKSKSSLLNKIGVKELAEENFWELTETDTGDFLKSLLGEGTEHPVLPALGLDFEKIHQVLKEKINKEVENSPQAIVETISSFLKEKILKAEIGLTGANAISATGQVLTLENEGNISLVSRIPKIHIIVAGIEKIVPSLEDALHVASCASLWGTGQKLVSYLNIISGPSKTADINNQLVIGAQGAREVHLILIDGWRSSFIGTDFEEFLYCINCGACFNTCPVFVSCLETIESLDPSSSFHCTTCASCILNCPAKIDWQKILRRAREQFVKEGKYPRELEEMIKNVREFGNPFGELKEGEIPKKLYCC